MKRTVALAIAVVLSSPSFGCAVRAGLANAPALGATPGVERRIHDVVANGNDSCERRTTGSPLRRRLPPCASDGSSPSPPSANVLPVAKRERDAGGWLNPLYLRWASCVTMFGKDEPFTSRPARSDSWMACANEGQ